MITIATIKLELSDWLYNSGIVGLTNILEYAGDRVKKYGSIIEFEDDVLVDFEEKYFTYFMDKYEAFSSWARIIEIGEFASNFKNSEIDDKKLKLLDDKIGYLKDKIKSASYVSGYEIIKENKFDIVNAGKSLKKINKSKKKTIEDVMNDIDDRVNQIKDICSFFRDSEVKRSILAKNVIYDVIARFWTGVSFLHTNNNKKDMYECCKTEFVDSVSSYLEADHSKDKYSCFSCDREITKLSKPSAYNLTWLNKMGVDMSKKTSHFWNLYGDSIICPICNLVYSCIPAGFTVIKGRGIFINDNSDIERLINVNSTTIDNTTSFEELEDEGYFRISDYLKQGEIDQAMKEIDNIQIVKLSSENERRPYTFNVLSKDKLKIMAHHKKRLKALIKTPVKVSSKEWINLYREVIGRLYDNKNQFDLIHRLFSLKFQDNFHKDNIIGMVIKINNEFIGGIMGKQGVYYKDIDKIQQLGYDLRLVYRNKNAENKVNGISYRLLNALKTKNQSRFMETMINAYMYGGKEIPVLLLDALKSDLQLQTIGYAFLLGIQGESGKLKTVKEAN